MMIQVQNQQTFLVRMWCEPAGEAWRCTITDTATNERRSFGSVAEFVTFLQRNLEGREPSQDEAMLRLPAPFVRPYVSKQ